MIYDNRTPSQIDTDQQRASLSSYSNLLNDMRTWSSHAFEMTAL